MTDNQDNPDINLPPPLIRISFVWQMRPMAPLTTTLGVARLDAG
jgi:hypothetical protein